MSKAILTLLLAVFASSTWLRADEIPPLHEGLETVPMPALSTLEATVADQIQRSRSSLERLHASSPQDAYLGVAYARLGQVLHAYGLLDAAAVCYRNALVLKPNEFAWYYYLAVLAQEAGALDQAKTYLQKAKARDDQYPALFNRLGEVALAAGQLDEAEAAFQREQKLSSPSASALFGLGRVAMARDDYALAEDYFKRTLAILPAANRVYYSLGMAYRGKGNRELAAFCLKRAGKIGPRPVDALLTDVERMARGARVFLINAKTSFEAGDYESALTLYRKGLATNPKNVTALVGIGSALGALDQKDEALEAYQQALALEPENQTALFNTGLIHFRKGDYDLAEPYFATVVQRNPEDHQAQFQLAEIYAATDRKKLALGHFKQLTSKSRRWVLPWLRLAAVANDLGEYDTAKVTLVQGIDLFEDQRLKVALTHFLVSCPDPKFREPLWGIELARELVDKQASSEHLLLLAKGYAGADQCEAAAKQARLALAALPEDATAELRAALTERVETYTDQRPCQGETP